MVLCGIAQKLAENLREMGFKPTQADCDFWIRECEDYYEYIAVIVDDLLIFSRDPDSIIDTLKTKYNYKLGGVGSPEYYNGADVSINEYGIPQMSAKTYIKNVIDRIEKLLQCTLKSFGSPMESGDHPETDESELLPPTDIPIYQMLTHNGQLLLEDLTFNMQQILLQDMLSCLEKDTSKDAIDCLDI